MTKTRQNQVPTAFNAFYRPLLEVKKLLQSNIATIEGETCHKLIKALIITHYTSFIIANLYRITNQRDVTKIKYIRGLIENMLEDNAFNLTKECAAKLISYIDMVAKVLNTNHITYIHIALYTGYLDFEIYAHFHSNLGLFDFKEYYNLNQSTINNMKDYYDKASALLSRLNAEYQAKFPTLNSM